MTSFRKLTKIIFINQSLSMGGAEHFTCELLSWFVCQGIKVKAFTTSNSFARKLKKEGIKVKKIPIIIDMVGDWKGFLKGIFLSVPGIFYYANLVFKNRNEGVIFLSGYIEKILVTPWARLLNIPVIWIEHGPLSPIINRFFGVPGNLYRFVSKYPDYVVFPSQYSMVSNIKISGIDKKKMIVINNGIFSLKKYPGKIIRKTAYCVSRLEKGKGQDILIKAWKKVAEKFPEAKLYIIGTGDFRTQLEELINRLDLQKNIILTGWVRNLALKISRVELGVFPSVWELEGFGVVILEAMSLGKPVVCFNHGPYPEVANSNSALVVKEKNHRSLADAIIDIFSDKDLSIELGECGKERFKKFFTVEKCGLEYWRVFERAIHDRKLFKNRDRYSIFIYDLVNKGFLTFIKDRIKKRKIFRNALYLLKKDYVFIEGKKLFVDKNDTVISDRLMNEGVWELGSTIVFKKYAKKSQLIVDVGANIGYYTIIAASVMKKYGKVIAFEPSNANYSLLNKTVLENKQDNIVLVKKAVGDFASTAYLYSGSSNSGDKKTYKTSIKDSKEKIEIMTLDDYFSNNEKIDLMKIDIEGFEVRAFEGGKKLLKDRRIKVIISELRPESLEMAGDNWYRYIELLEKSGFNIFDIEEETGKIFKFSKEKISEDYNNDKHLTVNILAVLEK